MTVLLDTSYWTLLRDILVKRSCKTLLLDTPLLPDTLVRHFYLTIFLDALT